VVLRPFLPTDLDAVTTLVARTFSQLFSPEMYLALQQAWPAGQLVAVEGGRLVGALLSMRRSGEVGRILVMAVQAGYQSMGVGSRLLGAYLRQCAMEGMSTVTLEVRVSNLRAQGFYRRHGFSLGETLTRYYTDGEDGVVMTRGVA
jgi:ribosomal-protein-alanine N-acetyltransferase